MDKSTYACGTFSFTFAAEWDAIQGRELDNYIHNGYSCSINERLDMKAALELLMNSGKWKPYPAVTDISKERLFPYEDECHSRSPLYNEYLYFNSHMRRLVYNQTDFQAIPSDAADVVGQYAAQVAERKDAVTILCWTPCQEEEYAYYLYRYISQTQIKLYKLPISSLELRLYSVGIMLLTIRCQDENPKEHKVGHGYWYETMCRLGKTIESGFVNSTDDVSWIENCGRRLFASRTVARSDSFKNLANDFPVVSAIAPATEVPINPFSGKINNAEKTVILCDLLPLFNRSKNHCTAPEYLQFVRTLISEHCISKTELRTTQILDKKKKNQTILVLDSFNDDRMYLHGTIESPEIAAQLKWAWLNRQEKDALNYLSIWYGILYSDQGWDATCQDPAMLMSAVEDATEARWCKYGTFHGMTYHSMIMLLGSLKGLEYLSANNDWIYLQMFLIAVLQRCAVQRFYREASGLLQTHSRKDDALRAAVQDKYTLFLNQFWFYEVTEQEQGKVMFSKLQKAMNIERDVEFLDRALEELHQQQENRTSSMVNKLLVPMSILGGFWAFTEMGLKIREAIGTSALFSLLNKDFWHGCAWVLLACIVIGMGWYAYNQYRYIQQLFGKTVSRLWTQCKRFIANGGWILLLIPIVGMLFTVISIHL